MSPLRNVTTTRASLLAVTAALIFGVCAQLSIVGMMQHGAAQPEPLVGTVEASSPELPLSSYFTVLDAPTVDGETASTGEIAQPAGLVTVYDAAGGNSIARIDAVESLPVVGRADGWVRVMLPSRLSLPGEEPQRAVNGGTGWIQEADVTIREAGVRLLVNVAEQKLHVMTPNGDLVIDSFPATIGVEVPLGPTFVAPGEGTSECGPAPINLIAQSEVSASYRGQPVSPIFISGPSPECSYTPEDVAEISPRIIQLTPEDLTELAEMTQPGTFIDVVASDGPAAAEPELILASYKEQIL